MKPPTETMTAQAVIGSCEYPERIEVKILREHDLSGFFVCEDAQGRSLVIHREKFRVTESRHSEPMTPRCWTE